MEQNSTPIQLIKFLYRETSTSETITMMKTLAKDRELQEELQDLQKLIRNYQR